MHSYGHWSLVNQFGGSDAFTWYYYGGQECASHFVKFDLLSWKMLAQSNKEYSLLLVIGRLQPGKASKEEGKLWQVWSKQIFWQLATEQIEKKN